MIRPVLLDLIRCAFPLQKGKKSYSDAEVCTQVASKLTEVAQVARKLLLQRKIERSRETSKLRTNCGAIFWREWLHCDKKAEGKGSLTAPATKKRHLYAVCTPFRSGDKRVGRWKRYSSEWGGVILPAQKSAGVMMAAWMRRVTAADRQRRALLGSCRRTPQNRPIQAQHATVR